MSYYKIEKQKLEQNLNDVQKMIDTTSKPNYSQTHCYTALELLQQMLNEEHKAYQSNIENYMVSSGHDYNIETISQVIELIKERQANAV